MSKTIDEIIMDLRRWDVNVEAEAKQAIQEAIERAYRSTQTSSVAEGLVTATFSTGTADEMYANLLRELGLDND